MSEAELWREIKRLQGEVERLKAREQTGRRWEGMLASNDAANPFGLNPGFGGTFAGLFIVVELTTGTIAAFLTGGTLITKVADTHSAYTTTAGTPNKINVYLDANVNVVIQNGYASSRLTWAHGWPVRAGN